MQLNRELITAPAAADVARLCEDRITAARQHSRGSVVKARQCLRSEARPLDLRSICANCERLVVNRSSICLAFSQSAGVAEEFNGVNVATALNQFAKRSDGTDALLVRKSPGCFGSSPSPFPRRSYVSLAAPLRLTARWLQVAPM